MRSVMLAMVALVGLVLGACPQEALAGGHGGVLAFRAQPQRATPLRDFVGRLLAAPAQFRAQRLYAQQLRGQAFYAQPFVAPQAFYAQPFQAQAFCAPQAFVAPQAFYAPAQQQGGGCAAFFAPAPQQFVAPAQPACAAFFGGY